MGGVSARFGQEWRARWPAMVGLALLIGLVGGTVMATAIGAQRTATAYDRFLVENRAEDILMGSPAAGTPEWDQIVADLEASPIVADLGLATSIGLYPPELGPFADSIAPLDEHLLVDVARPQLLDGRMPHADAVDEILIDPVARDRYGASVGDLLTLYAITEGEFYSHPGVDPSAYGDRRVLRVVGVGILANQVVPLAPLDDEPQFVVSPAYTAAHQDEWSSYGYYRIRFREGATDEQFDRLLDESLRALDIGFRSVPLVHGSERTTAVNRSIRPQAQALGAFSVLLGLAAVGVIGQLLARHLLGDAGVRRQLWAMGFTRRQLLGLAVGRVAVVLVGAVVIALAVAVGLSGRFPIGPARDAEPDPGTAVHLAGLALGSLVLVLVFLAIATVVVHRSLRVLGPGDGRSGSGSEHPNPVASLLARAGAPPSWVMGTRFALDRRSLTTAGAGAFVACALAVAAFVAAWTFGANLDHLVEDEALQGLTWDATVGNGFTGLEAAEAGTFLGDTTQVAGYSGANVSRLQIVVPGGDEAPENAAAVGIDQLSGAVYPRLIQGRAAVEPDEIVLGARLAQRLGVGVGDRVDAAVPGDDPTSVEVVGLAVLPGLGAGIFATTDLGEGAVVPAATFFDPTAGGPYTLFLVELAPGVDRPAVQAEIEAAYRELDSNCVPGLCFVTDLPPPGVQNSERLRSTPTALAGVLGLLAVVTLGANLVTSVRRRRRDLAVLRALGFGRRQTAATCAGHAVVVAVVASVIGVPVGIVVGRQLWTAFAERAGAFVPPETPVAAVLLAGPVTVLVAVVLAVVPGWMAARTNPALVLHQD